MTVQRSAASARCCLRKKLNFSLRRPPTNMLGVRIGEAVSTATAKGKLGRAAANFTTHLTQKGHFQRGNGLSYKIGLAYVWSSSCRQTSKHPVTGNSGNGVLAAGNVAGKTLPGHRRYRLIPPVSSRRWPLSQRAASVQRKATTPPMSSGSAVRPRAVA